MKRFLKGCELELELELALALELALVLVLDSSFELLADQVVHQVQGRGLANR